MVSGKFFELNGRKWFVKGLTYGPFAPGERKLFIPERPRVRADFKQIRALGANSIRVYCVPPLWLLDEAIEQGIRVLVDVPWEKHRCFFEDYGARKRARDTIAETADRLGDHDALFAISVANEFPADIVRYYGHMRVEKFIDELIDVVKQQSPECPATFANYPSTEFLNPSKRDFACFNIYLEEEDALTAYLDRLQHQSGSMPLILGEHGRDSARAGEQQQMKTLESQVRAVFRHGLSGSFVFSFTDDWYTGGQQIQDWAFGVTRQDRSEKPAADVLRRTWANAPNIDPAGDRPSTLPRVSVVVCAYNGAATLRECLNSLQVLNYPNYEIILVDDGSTDQTPGIARDFPAVRHIHQANLGLSVARNVGAQAATGQIVAYTDSDCFADPDWLAYLIRDMQRLGVHAIGGPNLLPPNDSWTAHCVALSPGGPSHVMLDDRLAEHVPGCNMAFDRDVLIGIGMFDAQFRQAGDDVDICWRLMDAGHRIGFSPSAVVWHHRRNTVRAYLKQQKGYGRAEAMLLAKHRQRFNLLGCSQWNGIIYGEGAVGLPVAEPIIYHGRHGRGLFQIIYAQQKYALRAYVTLLEWHAVAVFILALSIFFPWLAIASTIMWAVTFVVVARSTLAAAMRPDALWWCRPVVFLLHLVQPVTRAWHRYVRRLSGKHAPTLNAIDRVRARNFKRIDVFTRDGYWDSTSGKGRGELLAALESRVADHCIHGIIDHEWDSWDVLLLMDRWHNVAIRSATEELGGLNRFTRVRISTRLTRFASVIVAATGAWAVAAVVHGGYAADSIGLVALAIVLGKVWISRRRALAAVSALVDRAAAQGGLKRFHERFEPRKRRRRKTASSPSPSSEELDIDDAGEVNVDAT